MSRYYDPAIARKAGRAAKPAVREKQRAGLRLARAKRSEEKRQRGEQEQQQQQPAPLPPWLAGDTSALPKRPPGKGGAS